MTEFDKILQEQLKDGEQATPSFIWDNIEQEIEEDKRRGSIIPFWGCLVAMLLICGVVAGAWWHARGLESQPEAVVMKNTSLTATSNSNTKTIKNVNQASKKASSITQELKPIDNSGASKDQPQKNGKVLDKASNKKTNTIEKIVQESTKQSSRKSPNSRPNFSIGEPPVPNLPSGMSVVPNDNIEGHLVARDNVSQDEETATKEGKAMNTTKDDSPLVSPDRDTNSLVTTPVVALEEKDKEDDITNVASDRSPLLSPNIDSNSLAIISDGMQSKQDSFLLMDSFPTVDALFLDATKLAILDSLSLDSVRLDSTEKQPLEDSKTKKWFVQVKAGFSTYSMSIWKDEFELGALSQRAFPATGVNLNVSAGYQFNKWLNPIVGFSYNGKQAQFKYSALYDYEGFLIHNIHGNLMPLDQLNDDISDSLCNQYILRDIEANFYIASYAVTIGNKFRLWNKGRIGVEVDLSYSLELNSRINLNRIQKIDVQDYLNDAFNSRINGGATVTYQLTPELRLLFEAEYIFMPKSVKSNNFYRGDWHELIFSIGARYNF